jgi:hypothetical protein
LMRVYKDWCYQFFLCLFFLRGVVKLMALHLLGNYSITWPTPPALFVFLVIFQIESRVLCLQ